MVLQALHPVPMLRLASPRSHAPFVESDRAVTAARAREIAPGYFDEVGEDVAEGHWNPDGTCTPTRTRPIWEFEGGLWIDLQDERRTGPDGRMRPDALATVLSRGSLAGMHGLDVTENLVGTPLLGRDHGIGPHPDDRRRGRVVLDLTERCASSVREMVPRDMAVVDGGMRLRIPGAFVVGTQLRGEVPRLATRRSSYADRWDVASPLHARVMQEVARGWAVDRGGRRGGTRSTAPASVTGFPHHLSGDEDLRHFANVAPARALALSWPRVQRALRWGGEAELRGMVAGLRRWEALGEVGMVTREEVPAVAYDLVDFLTWLLSFATYDNGLPELSYMLAHVEGFVLPRLRPPEDDGDDRDDLAALAGIGRP